MNKTEIVADIADEADLTKADAQRALDAFFNVLAKCASKKEKVQIPGFLTMETVAQPEKMGRNPRDGSPIKIAARNRVTMKVGKTLKDAANGNSKKK